MVSHIYLITRDGDDSFSVTNKNDLIDHFYSLYGEGILDGWLHDFDYAFEISWTQINYSDENSLLYQEPQNYKVVLIPLFGDLKNIKKK